MKSTSTNKRARQWYSDLMYAVHYYKTELSDYYKNPSYAKQSAYKSCLNKAIVSDATYYAVTGANSNAFTFCFLFKKGNETYLGVETAVNSYTFLVNHHS